MARGTWDGGEAYARWCYRTVDTSVASATMLRVVHRQSKERYKILRTSRVPGASAGRGKVEQGVDREPLVPSGLDQQIPNALAVLIDQLLAALSYQLLEVLKLSDGHALQLEVLHKDSVWESIGKGLKV